MSKNLQKIDGGLPDFKGRLTEMKSRIQGIQLLLRDLLKENVHFGIIPGTDKLSLYKPGAELMAALFNLKPKFTMEVKDLPGEHVTVLVNCELFRIGEDQALVFMGSGVGACTTLESKYRYRDTEPISTGRPVTKQYWDLRKKCMDASGQAKTALQKDLAELLGGKGFITKKINDKWMICQRGEKGENPNPQEQLNTVIKMAKKRAFVDAVISTTGGSDMFSQDIGDLELEEETEKQPSVEIVPPPTA